MNREHLQSNKLPELSRFNEARGVNPGEMLDLSLANSPHSIQLFVSAENTHVAQAYSDVIGKIASGLEVITVDTPIEAAMQVRDRTTIPLVLHSATDPILNKRMFADGPNFGQLLMGHIYTPRTDHASPSLFGIGVANQGLEILGNTETSVSVAQLQAIDQKRRELLGGVLSNYDIRNILKSNRIHTVIAHALGPAGTNISQAMEQYINSLGIAGKTKLIVQKSGVEPREYAEIAARQVQEGVIPLHMECAVFYHMKQLFEERPREVVFADHYFMPLDEMQLVSKTDPEAQAMMRKLRVATHPSPRPLMDPWVNANRAEWIKAPSNAAAAQMVLSGEVDAGITTGSGLAQAESLTSQHVFGSPYMLFTIGTPLSQEQLRTYMK